MEYKDFNKIKHFHPHTDPKLRDYRHINFRVVLLADRLRKNFGKPLRVVSAVREQTKNTDIGGAKKSRHLPRRKRRDGEGFAREVYECDALDLGLYNKKDFPALVMAALRTPGLSGFGLYDMKTIHIDVRPFRGNKGARWISLNGSHKRWTWANLQKVMK